MKTVIAVDLGSHGVLWRQIPNSIPEGHTLSTKIGVPHKMYETQVANFKVNRAHVALDEDVRVLEIKTERGWNASQLLDYGWKRLGHKRPSNRCLQAEHLEDGTCETAIEQAIGAWKVDNWVEYTTTANLPVENTAA